MAYKVYTSKTLPPSGTVGAIYGKPGAGKTTVLADLADSPYAAPLLVLDLEGGSKVFSHRDDIHVIPIEDPTGKGEAWDTMEEVVADLISRKIKIADKPPGTVILDNMSELIYACRRNVVNKTSRNVEMKDRPDQKDWNTTTERMLLLTRKLRDFGRNSGTNVFFIAWEAPDTDENTGITVRDFAFNPALARVFPGLVDFVGYLTVVNKDTRRLSFEASKTTAAKFRKSADDAALKIPGVIDFKQNDKVLVDILAVLKGGAEWPTEKYTPKKSA